MVAAEEQEEEEEEEPRGGLRESACWHSSHHSVARVPLLLLPQPLLADREVRFRRGRFQAHRF